MAFAHHGLVRVAAAVPRVAVANPQANAEAILDLLAQAETAGVALAVFPELCVTGYTCGDLFQQAPLLSGAEHALHRLIGEGKRVFDGVAVVGVPLIVDGQLFNCAVAFQRGRVLGVVPKAYLPNYKEFYEQRWFAPAHQARATTLRTADQDVPFGLGIIFRSVEVPSFAFGIEICEDLWVPNPPSSTLALHGATVLLNPSASNEVIGKAAYRRQLVTSQSGRCIAGYVYASCGVGESTTDVVFGGHALIAENGTLLAESRRFHDQPQLLVSDIDVDRMSAERLRVGTFGDAARQSSLEPMRTVPFAVNPACEPLPLRRVVDPHPFVPKESSTLAERCEEIFQTQVTALAQRLRNVGYPRLTLGVSGGLDSTLALLVSCQTLDALEQPRTQLQGFTMPGFGTTQRTLANARDLMRHLGVTAREVDIRGLCLEEMRLLGHAPFGIDLAGMTLDQLTVRLKSLPADRRADLVFENVQARMRTNLLMNAGFVVGTGDLSELALGWCTYNGDHTSMYNPNASIPKTLVKFLVRWAAEHRFTGAARQTLLDIVGTEISPELLPLSTDDTNPQSTESVLGPYELHDFFLYHVLRYGAPPDKVLFLADQAGFGATYGPERIRQWLRVFLTRFFANQFKRSCLPDGPKVGTISLSPRGDWRMPSDAQAAAWLAALLKE